MDIHPHWDSTGDSDEVLISAIHDDRKSVSVPIAASATTMSRRPAALVGILIVVLLGVTYSGGWSDLIQGIAAIRAQLGSSQQQQAEQAAPAATATQTTVALTVAGVVPPSITVRPGDSFVLRNDTDTLQIIESKTLFESDGSTLSTAAIAPGGSETITLSPTQLPGAFTFASAVNPALTGTVNVNDAGKVGFGESLNNVPLVTGEQNLPTGATPVSNPTANDTTGIPSADSAYPAANTADPIETITAPMDTAAPAEALPQNPYTVGNTSPYVFDANGQPTAGATAHASATQAPGRLTPPSNTDSGPALWLTFALSGIALFTIARKHIHLR